MTSNYRTKRVLSEKVRVGANDIDVDVVVVVVIVVEKRALAHFGFKLSVKTRPNLATWNKKPLNNSHSAADLEFANNNNWRLVELAGDENPC